MNHVIILSRLYKNPIALKYTDSFWPHTCKKIQTGANASVHLKTIILLYTLVRLKSGLQKIRTFGFSENRTYPKNPDLYDLTEQKLWIGTKMIVFKNQNGRTLVQRWKTLTAFFTELLCRPTWFNRVIQ